MEKTETLYLGSASPRRYELIRQMGLPCRVLEFHMREVMDQSLPPEELALGLAEQKMKACLEAHGTERWVVTADTLIALDGKKLGKPADEREAGAMLESLQGRSHQVFTGVALFRPRDGKELLFHDETEVFFSPMDREERQRYLDTQEWRGVAGGYRIQERGGLYVEKLRGSYFNVMGLPINLLYGMLRQLNFSQ